MFLRQRAVVLLLVICVCGVASYAYAQTQEPPAQVSAWLISNAWAVAVCIFNIGFTWRQVIDLQRRVTAIERAYEDDVPTTYARKDVLAEQMTAINRELRNWRESFSFLLRRPDRRQDGRPEGEL